jgi:hypothetical protein
MPVELDHIFLCVSPGAPEAARLIEFGCFEGPPNLHPGQGTANRRFFFENAYLELLWVETPAEARNPQTAPTILWDRWSRRSEESVSPFGIIMRPASEGVPPPFSSWEYRPDYLPAGTCLHIADTGISEPMWVLLPPLSGPTRELPPHPNGLCKITALRLAVPTPPRSAAARSLPLLSIEPGPSPLLSNEFDHGLLQDSTDFRPALPLLCKR